jgi:hypothetical protein
MAARQDAREEQESVQGLVAADRWEVQSGPERLFTRQVADFGTTQNSLVWEYTTLGLPHTSPRTGPLPGAPAFPFRWAGAFHLRIVKSACTGGLGAAIRHR